jgi:hypothetical protein
MIKKWFLRTTPFVILAVITAMLFVFQMVFAKTAFNDWKYNILIKLFLFLVFVVAVDVLLKWALKKNSWLWAIELFLCLALVYGWIIS